MRTNIFGTCTLLHTAKTWWNGLNANKEATFYFFHSSTDEVFGALQPDGSGLYKNNTV